MKTASFNC